MPEPAVHRSALARSLRRALVCLGVALLLGSALLLTVVIDQDPSVAWGFVIYTASCWIWALAGIFAWWRRPSNGLGALLVLGGIALNLGEANNSAIVVVSAVGTVFATAILAVMVHLLHAFPSGRIRGRASRFTVAGGYIVAIGLQFPLYAFNAAAAPLPVFVADRPDLVSIGGQIQELCGAAVMVATTVILAGRLRRAKPYQRRVLIPLFGYGMFAVLWIPISSALLPIWFEVDPLLLALSQIVVVALVPLAFVLAVFRGGFARTGELEELATWLGAPGDHRPDLSSAIASVLGDPSLELVFWVPERRRYVNSAGDQVPLPEPGTQRSSVPIQLSGDPIGAIIYDSELIADPELVRTAGRVVALGVDRERLTAALRVTEQSLRRSRERIIETADQERRRIAQDLHDGLQVQLVLLALEAQQLANQLDSSVATRVSATQLRRGIDGAAAELRTLVHAVMPSSLVERGLAMATEDLVDRLAVPTSLQIGTIGSLSRPVESTAYFVVAEAVANVVKHAGASKVAVRLEETAGVLVIEVIDNGVGGASMNRGNGIRGLLDRADVLGGSLQLTSPAGEGTNLLVKLPISQ
ncbi:MAG: histidine kinase [Nakamurella sp.]